MTMVRTEIINSWLRRNWELQKSDFSSGLILIILKSIIYNFYVALPFLVIGIYSFNAD